MREVTIIGIGQTPVSEHWEKSLLVLAGEAVFAALEDAGLKSTGALYVGNMLSGVLDKQNHMGTLIVDWVGMRGHEAFKIEAACGSGAAAFRMGLMAVASGEIDSAVVVGVEKMTDSLPKKTTAGLATAADADWEIIHGLSFIGINALIMQRYIHEYGWKHEDFAPFSINAHNNALHNPNARLHIPLTKERYLKAAMISDPINLMDSSAIGDGAAAAVIVPADAVHQPDDLPKITVTGSGAATDSIAVHDRRDPLWLTAAEKSAKQAYHQSGVGPEDIDIFEVHDAFSIMSALSLEASGFAERGQGPRLGLDGEIGIDGRIPITTRGGLKARGHPVGATGMYQIVEVVEQLRGQADGSQVQGAKIGMAQNIGGSGATILTHILKSE
ncbi:MAG: thiolase domain-containing protein [Anaerolineales bacterium]|nr:thiolase domain-containing protein [Chloroflexota bacterium]MBL6981286.1 thiolase domain-containing protein [Anaerolineales bacterium]